MRPSQHTQQHSEECIKVHCVCVSLSDCFSFASHSPLQQTQHSHWSKIGAGPHLGTLPSLKQIRPQRLIKKTLRPKLASTDEGVPKRGEATLGYPAPSEMNLCKTERCFSARRDNKYQSLHCLRQIHTHRPLFFAVK